MTSGTVKLKKNADGKFNIQGYLDGVVCDGDLVKSKIVRGYYFAAVSQDWGDGEKIHCIVVSLVTEVSADGDVLSVRSCVVPETIGPDTVFCPNDIFVLLSPVDGEKYQLALDWRAKCLESVKLSVGKRCEVVTGRSVKTYRLNVNLANQFREVCKSKKMSQTSVLESLMKAFIQNNIPSELLR